MDQATHYYLVFETAGGFCGIAWNSVGITRFQLPTRSPEATKRILLHRAPGAKPGTTLRCAWRWPWLVQHVERRQGGGQSHPGEVAPKPDLRAILVGLPHPTFAALQDRAYERAGSARKRPSAEGVASYPPFGMSLYIRPPFMIIARLVSGFSRSAMSAIGSPLTTRRSARASFSTTPSFPG